MWSRSSDSCAEFIGGFSRAEKAFLESADSAYALTYKQMDMRHISKFVTRPVYMEIYSTLTFDRPWAGISDKFKRTTWTLRKRNGNALEVVKTVVFDKVQVSKQLRLSVADDYCEIWKVSDTEEKYVVESITPGG